MAQPQRLGAVLGAVLEQSRQRARTIDTIRAAWPALVGRRMAAHAQPVSVRQRRLIVHVDQPGAGYLFRFQRAPVTERLRALTHGQVEELVVRVGELHAVSH